MARIDVMGKRSCDDNQVKVEFVKARMEKS